MKLTARDQQVLRMLAGARWLTTGQLAALCFANVRRQTMSQRLSLLRKHGYFRCGRTISTNELLYALGSKGVALLTANGWPVPLCVERVPPANDGHFLGINDIRVAVVCGARRDGLDLAFFFASWELQQLGWPWSVIPDAVARLRRADDAATLLFEYDRGTERAATVVRSKLLSYDRGLDGFPFSFVITVTDTDERIERLRPHVTRCDHPDKFAFVTRPTLTSSWSPSIYIP